MLLSVRHGVTAHAAIRQERHTAAWRAAVVTALPDMPN
jgi:hypothetical protein